LHTTDSDYALLYAYGRFFSDGKHAETFANLGPTVLVTGQLGSEIIELVGEISSLFGVLNEDVIELQ
jgi:hypothetical protein